MEAECLAFVVEVTGPLVHWASLIFAIPSSIFLGFVLGRWGRARQIAILTDEVARWRIVAKARGWHYSIKTLRGTEILVNPLEE